MDPAAPAHPARARTTARHGTLRKGHYTDITFRLPVGSIGHIEPHIPTRGEGVKPNLIYTGSRPSACALSIQVGNSR